MALSRWNDDRLDDLAAEVRMLNQMPEKIIRVETELINVSKDAQACLEEVKTLNQHLSKREEEQRIERKSDRRWLVGTGMTSASLVIAALALLADRL